MKVVARFKLINAGEGENPSSRPVQITGAGSHTFHCQAQRNGSVDWLTKWLSRLAQRNGSVDWLKEMALWTSSMEWLSGQAQRNDSMEYMLYPQRTDLMEWLSGLT